MDCVEVYAPYVETFQLRQLYKHVFIKNVTDFGFTGYDLAILGDVLEHLTQEEAETILTMLATKDLSVIVQVPYMLPQGPGDGGKNLHDAHQQADLTHEVFMERYGKFGLSLLVKDGLLGVYVRHGPKENDREVTAGTHHDHPEPPEEG
jgi:hypothetical protein